MDYDSMTNPKPRFYKRKTFYIPLLAFFILFLITITLLYKPLKLLIWTAIEYPKEKEYLGNLIMEFGDDTMQEFAKTYTIDTTHIDNALYYTKTAERDFLITRYLGFDNDYVGGYYVILEVSFNILILGGFITLCERYSNYITPTNKERLSYMQSKILELITNIDIFLQFLSKHEYFNNDAYKFIHAMRLAGIHNFYILLYSSNKTCYLKEKDILLQQMQESYNALLTLKDKKVLENIAIRYGSYDTMLARSANLMSRAKEYFNECK